MIRTRFAPSPTGPLHLGHAYSAIVAHDFARHNGGEFLVRIEDLDHSRSRPHWEDQIVEDLVWLGLTWETPVMRQSERVAAYDKVLDHLWDQSLIYPCTCTRRDIAAAVSAPQEGEPLHGPDGIVYPGTCRQNTPLHGQRPKDQAIRLNIQKAASKNATDGAFSYLEIGPLGQGSKNLTVDHHHAIKGLGDIVVARRDMAAAYHLAVVIDDAAQGITHVVRGADLAPATEIHVVLQHCLNLPTPTYFHHDLIRDDTGKRLAKRDDSKAIAKYRDEGLTPSDVRELIGL